MKKLLTFVLAVLALCFTSCFQIIEEIQLNRNGSGTKTLTIDMSEMMGMFKGMIPDSLTEEMNFDESSEADLSRYKDIEGISNVKSEKKGEYIQSISFDFDNLDALHRSMAVSNEQQEKLQGPMSTKFHLKRKRFSRITSVDNGDKLKEREDINSEEMNQLMGMMKSPTYKLIYKMPKKVKEIKVGNAKAKWEKNGKEVVLEYDMMDFMYASGNVMDHEIKF